MLTLVSDGRSRDCAGITRRDFIQIGALGLGGLSLPGLLAARDGSSFVRDKSVVLLFCSGGASHIETFDPHMDAPGEIRSMTGEVRTTLPGVSFGGTFPRLAKLAHKMAVVRSFQHPIGGHVQAIVHVLTGGTDVTGKGDEGQSIGSVYARLRGVNHPATGLPTNTLLSDDEVDPQYRNERGRVRKGSNPGQLGSIYAPFEPDGKGPSVTNMTLNLPADRIKDRRALRKALDVLKRRTDARGTMEAMDRYEQLAVDLVLRGAGDAFDFSKEDPRIVERYDTSHIPIGKKKFRPSTLGHQMLMARRLCEAGCGFVTVHSAGWDMHADGNNPGILKGMNMLGTTVDIAVSAFLEDLEARGLSDKVLLVITGDFGRTPRINKRGGRDHWARLGTLAFAGGGLRMGQIVGQSDRKAGEPASEPISPGNMMATIFHTLFDVGELRLQRGIPADVMSLIEREQPIRELF